MDKKSKAEELAKYLEENSEDREAFAKNLGKLTAESREAFEKSLKAQNVLFASVSEATKKYLSTLHKTLSIPEEVHGALKRSLEVQTAPIASILRLSGELEKSFEPIRQAMRAISQMPMPQLPKLELPNNNVVDSEYESINEMPQEESLVQAFDTITKNLPEIAKILSETSAQSDVRACEANSIAVSANLISAQSLEVARQANGISEKSVVEAKKANCLSKFAIGAAIISAGIAVASFIFR